MVRRQQAFLSALGRVKTVRTRDLLIKRRRRPNAYTLNHSKAAPSHDKPDKAHWLNANRLMVICTVKPPQHGGGQRSCWGEVRPAAQELNGTVSVTQLQSRGPKRGLFPTTRDTCSVPQQRCQSYSGLQMFVQFQVSREKKRTFVRVIFGTAHFKNGMR